MKETMYFPLNRTFLEFQHTEGDDDIIDHSVWMSMLGRGESWQEMLKTRHIVVLGEAGAGKTTELREQARRLSGTGQPAFFIPFFDLAQDGLAYALSPEDTPRLANWIRADTDALFFLDSVDEASLSVPRALERAVKKLAQDLDSAWPRARLVISCRVSNWQSRTDLDELHRMLPNPSVTGNIVKGLGEEEQADDEDTLDGPAEVSWSQGGQTPTQPRTLDESESRLLRVMQLAPLDLDQVTSLARHWGVEEVDDFSRALKTADAEIFAGRPQDVEWLATYWRENRSLGTLTHLIEYNIQQKLKESNPEYRQKTDLTPQQAYEGALIVAAAVVFCRRPMILLPDRVRDPRLSSGALEPDEILPGWKPPLVESLLTRPIFDEATNGRVRFHHRSVAEYLAAQWVLCRLKNGVPLREIRNLFFAEYYGRTVLIASRLAVAGWVASDSPEIRNKLLEVAPEQLLFTGDPQRVPLPERQASLKRLTELYAGRTRLGWGPLDRHRLKRAASPELTPLINSLLSGQPEAREVRKLLLYLVTAGALIGCAESVLSIATNTAMDEDTRRDAIKTLGARYALNTSGITGCH